MEILRAFVSRGHAVYLPYGDGSSCDMIVDYGSKLSRVQCKTGRLRKGGIVFHTCTIGRNPRNPTTYEGKIDEFAIYCPETDKVYTVPISSIKGTGGIFLRIDPPRNYQKKGIHRAEDYELEK